MQQPKILGFFPFSRPDPVAADTAEKQQAAAPSRDVTSPGDENRKLAHRNVPPGRLQGLSRLSGSKDPLSARPRPLVGPAPQPAPRPPVTPIRRPAPAPPRPRPPPRSPSPPPAPPQLSELEREREERMRLNREKLAKLGLPQAVAKLAPAPAPAAKPAKKRQRAEPVVVLNNVPRRLTRSRTGAKPPPKAPPPSSSSPSRSPSPVAYRPSDVVQYAIEPTRGEGGATSSAFESDVASSEDLLGFPNVHAVLRDTALKGIYSMSWQGPLLAAGGKDGRAAIFVVPATPTADAAPLQPLLSARLHRSWIADVQLVPREASSPEGGPSCDGDYDDGIALPWLLSASNGPELCAWDVALVDDDGLPLRTATCETGHTDGIFSMHARAPASGGGGAVNVATSSKDSSLALCCLGPDGLRAVARWEDVHVSVAKCVRWRDDAVVASCGNEGSIKLLDTRIRGAAAVCLKIAQAYDSAVNHLQWQPTAAPDLLLTSSFDPVIKLYDVRQPAAPVAELRGHTAQQRCGRISQPQWVWGGRGVVTGGERNNDLTLFDLQADGAPKIVSAGDVGFSPSCLRATGRLLAAGSSRGIHVLRASAT